jgi:hypothetical protein
MKIGIIGSGHPRATLERAWARRLHRQFERTGNARRAGRGDDRPASHRPRGGARQGPGDHRHSREEYPRPAQGPFASGDRSVVVDTGNYYPKRDGRIAPIEDGTPESQWVAQQLGRPVVKAFNTMYAQHLLERGRAADQAGRIALPIAGDDSSAKAVVLQLIDELGFDGVDAGTLAESWRQQPGTPVYGADLKADEAQEALGAARPERTAEFSAASPRHTRP